MTVSLEDARRIIAGGERYAVHLGQPVNIAVVDHAGILVAHVRMDNARRGTADISVDRACAARAWAEPAHLVGHAAVEGRAAVGGRAGAEGPAGREGLPGGEGPDALEGRVGAPGPAGGLEYRMAVPVQPGGDDQPGGPGLTGRAHLLAAGRGTGGGHPAPPGATVGLPGALPLWRDGAIVGAVGVSGGPAPLDQAIARAASAAF